MLSAGRPVLPLPHAPFKKRSTGCNLDADRDILLVRKPLSHVAPIQRRACAVPPAGTRTRPTAPAPTPAGSAPAPPCGARTGRLSWRRPRFELSRCWWRGDALWRVDFPVWPGLAAPPRQGGRHQSCRGFCGTRTGPSSLPKMPRWPRWDPALSACMCRTTCSRARACFMNAGRLDGMKRPCAPSSATIPRARPHREFWKAPDDANMPCPAAATNAHARRAWARAWALPAWARALANASSRNPSASTPRRACRRRAKTSKPLLRSSSNSPR